MFSPNHCIHCKQHKQFCDCRERSSTKVDNFFNEHCLRCGYSYPTGGTCKCKILKKESKVTQVNKIDAFQVEGIINAKTGDILIHHSGRRYFVNSVSNLQDTQKFPKTITYVEFNMVAGEVYSRPVKELVRTMFNTSYHGERLDA